MKDVRRGRTEPNPAKVEAVKKLTERLENASAVYLTDFTGLDVELMTKLRREFHEANADYIVSKKSLTRLALKDAGWTDLLEMLDGSVGLALGHDDPAEPARIITRFAKETEKLPVRGGIFEGRRIGPADLEKIRMLPTRIEALTGVVQAVGGPLQNFAGVIAGILQNFVGVLDAIIEKKKAAAEEA
ncbi:50S ribosomal protein L10 [bacterium]|nr:50S ribosomal protein L10 [bacterium]